MGYFSKNNNIIEFYTVLTGKYPSENPWKPYICNEKINFFQDKPKEYTIENMVYSFLVLVYSLEDT